MWSLIRQHSSRKTWPWVACGCVRWETLRRRTEWRFSTACHRHGTLCSRSKSHPWRRYTSQNLVSCSLYHCHLLCFGDFLQARVSDDYQPGNSQWKIGVTSLIAHALDVAPFKDNHWTTSNQTGNLYGKKIVWTLIKLLVFIRTVL